MELIELIVCKECDDVAIIWRDEQGLISFTKCLCVTIGKGITK